MSIILMTVWNSFNNGKILYSVLDGNAAYCMNFGLRADGGQLMNSYDNPSTEMSSEQQKLLSYCLYYGYGTNEAAAPTNDQSDEYIATQSMVWIIMADIFGTDDADSAAKNCVIQLLILSLHMNIMKD